MKTLEIVNLFLETFDFEGTYGVSQDEARNECGLCAAVTNDLEKFMKQHGTFGAMKAVTIKLKPTLYATEDSSLVNKFHTALQTCEGVIIDFTIGQFADEIGIHAKLKVFSRDEWESLLKA